jgi:hypothetical protein
VTRARTTTIVSRKPRLQHAGLLAMAVVLTLPASAGADRRGSVRHSGTKSRSTTTTRTRTTRTTTSGRATTSGRRGGTRSSARAGYRRGYSRGRYAGRHDAWHDYRRWRAVTGAGDAAKSLQGKGAAGAGGGT